MMKTEGDVLPLTRRILIFVVLQHFVSKFQSTQRYLNNSVIHYESICILKVAGFWTTMTQGCF